MMSDYVPLAEISVNILDYHGDNDIVTIAMNHSMYYLNITIPDSFVTSSTNHSREEKT